MSSSQTDEKIPFNYSQQNLKQCWEKLHVLSEKINELTLLLPTSDTTLSNKQSMLLADLSTELRAIKRTYLHLLSLIEPTLEMVGESDDEKLLAEFCKNAQLVINPEYAVAVSLDYDGKVCHTLKFGTNPLVFNIESIDADFIRNISQHKSAFIQSDTTPLITPWQIDYPCHILFAPLLTQNQIYGFAYFINRIDHQCFNDSDIQIINTLARKCAMHFENIHFSERIQQQRLQLKTEMTKVQSTNDELHKNNRILRQFAENIDDVFWRSLSLSDKIIFVNPKYHSIDETSSNLFYHDPQTWQDSVIDEDKVRVKSFLKEIAEKQQDSSLEYRIKHPNGTIRNIYNKAICLKDDSGKLHQIISIASDITEFF